MPSGRGTGLQREPHHFGDHIGDFYLMSALGTGAFGTVFLARQESMQRLVALKVSNDKGTEAQTLGAPRRFRGLSRTPTNRPNPSSTPLQLLHFSIDGFVCPKPIKLVSSKGRAELPRSARRAAIA